MLRDKENRIIDIAMEYGFGSHVTFTRAFKETYGITPSQYRDKPIGLQNFEKPDLSLGYIVVDEGVPLISDGLVLEMNRKYLEEPINFLGVTGYYPFKYGKMFGERTVRFGTGFLGFLRISHISQRDEGLVFLIMAMHQTVIRVILLVQK